MEFKNTKVSDELVPEGVSQLYQGHVVKTDAIGADELGSRVADRLKIDPSVASNVLRAFASEIIACIKAGERPILEGVFTTRFVCNGSFESEDDVWDKSRNSVGLSFITLDPVKGAVSTLVPKNVLGKVTVQLIATQDETTLETNVLTVGHKLLGQGRGIKINAENADEGLYLVKASSGTAYKATIVDNTAGTIDATFAADIPAGDDYTLELRGRAGNGMNRSLVVSKITGFEVKSED